MRAVRLGLSPFLLLAVALVGLGVALTFELVHADVCTPAWRPPTPEAADRCVQLADAGHLPGVAARTVLALLAGVFALVGSVVADQRPRHPVGWLFGVLGLVVAAGAAASQWVLRTGISAPGSLPGEGVAAWIADLALMTPAVYGLVVLAVLVVPDGRPMRGWRWLVPVTAAATAMLYAASAVRDTTSAVAPWRANPTAVPALDGVRDVVESASLLVVVLCLLAAIAHTVVRLRRSEPEERLRLRPLAAAAAVTTLILAVGPLLWSVDQPGVDLLWQALFLLGLCGLPVTAGAAVLRGTLFDVDVVLRRTLVYGVLAAFVLVVHLLAVAGVSALVAAADPTSPVVPLLATVVAAVGFEPVRRRTQRAVDRLMHGDRRDAGAVYAQLAAARRAAASPQEALDDVLAGVARALRLQSAAVERWDGTAWQPAAVVGDQSGEVTELPLAHHGQQVGRLLLGERHPGELRRLDQAVRAALSAGVGASLHAAVVAEELARSRGALLAAREEERRMLRRELHDGLGASLAGIGMAIHAARIGCTEPPVAVVLDDAAGQVADAGTDLRRLVDGLRPPALDDGGLVHALHQLVGRLSPGHPVELDVNGVDGLPAAVELAAYRIAGEAVTNAVRHAGATRCLVSVQVARAERAVVVEVTDDGRGLPPDVRPGVGLLSMQQRARELGGTCHVDRSDAGGTRVLARLPLVFGNAQEVVTVMADAGSRTDPAAVERV